MYRILSGEVALAYLFVLVPGFPGRATGALAYSVMDHDCRVGTRMAPAGVVWLHDEIGSGAEGVVGG